MFNQCYKSVSANEYNYSRQKQTVCMYINSVFCSFHSFCSFANEAMPMTTLSKQYNTFFSQIPKLKSISRKPAAQIPKNHKTEFLILINSSLLKRFVNILILLNEFLRLKPIQCNPVVHNPKTHNTVFYNT